MNVILSENILYTIPNKVVEYTPYLRTLRDTSNNKDMDDNRYILDNITLRQIGVYSNFILSCDIRIANIPTLLYISDFLGNKLPIDHGYPIKYYIAMIKDWWMENISREPIAHSYNTSRYDNHIDIRNFLDNVIGRESYYIAGSYACYICNIFNNPSDIDVFLKDKSKVDDIINACNNTGLKYKIHKHVINIVFGNLSIPIQIVLNQYDSMVDIMSSFDLDSCCFIYYNHVIYCNNKATYALNNKVNHFRPEQYSDRYSSRLLKYYKRGFDIEIPKFVPLEDMSLIGNSYVYPYDYLEEQYDENDQLVLYKSFNIKPVEDRDYIVKHTNSYSSDEELLSVPAWEEDLFDKYKTPLENMDQFYGLTTLIH